MNDTNSDIHNPIFRTLQEMNTSQLHTYPTSYIKTEPTIRNIQNSDTQHQRKNQNTNKT
jgi:hypothetical protein